MLERNILTLLSHNVREIFLAVSALEKSVLAFARGRGQKVACAGGGELKLLVEEHPRGTIGAARVIRTTSDDVIVVNVDNLTSLDLSALLQHHRASGATLTVATHIEPFQIPFGQVSMENGEIVDYKEKPILPVPLCSGTYVLTKTARLSIPSRRPSSAPELVDTLLRAKHKVSAFFHSSPWIDVNDRSSVEKAEALIMANFQGFELWRQPAAEETVTLCVLKEDRVALVKSNLHPASTTSRFLMENVRAQDGIPLRTACRLQGQMGLPRHDKPFLLASFDEIVTRTRQRTRHHIYISEVDPKWIRVRSPIGGGFSWARVSHLAAGASDFRGNSRVLAYLRRYVVSQSPHSLSHR